MCLQRVQKSTLFQFDDSNIKSIFNHIPYIINGCKKKKKLKKLEMLKIMLKINSIFYAEKQMQDIMIEF